MSCCEEKPGKISKKWALINIGFVAGILFVLLTYLLVSRQTTISGLNVATTVSQWITDKQLIKCHDTSVVTSDVQKIADKKPIQSSGEAYEHYSNDEAENGKVVYNSKGYQSETCEVDGDVRINSTSLSVFLVIPTTSSSEHRQWSIRPYSRKTIAVKNVTVTQLPDKTAAPACTVNYTIPAVLFALGGLTGNFWHDFTDVLVPLFIASRRYDGEVQFLITNMQPWFPVAYKTILRRLSKYDAVDLAGDDQVRCFPHVTVGLHQHRDLGIIPEWAPGGRLSTPDFTRFLREVYFLPRVAPVSLDKKPRLLLIHRSHSRRFMNEQEILQAAEAAGFEAVAMDLRREETVDAQARVVNSFDVLLGVHGAGLTNLVFLPPGAVVIQVVPYGKMEVIARLEFGEPAKDMGLKYLDYVVSVEESTLLEMLGPEHLAIKDPDSVHRSGWNNMTKFYLNKQSVRLNISRFTPTLAQAFDYLHQQ